MLTLGISPNSSKQGKRAPTGGDNHIVFIQHGDIDLGVRRDLDIKAVIFVLLDDEKLCTGDVSTSVIDHGERSIFGAGCVLSPGPKHARELVIPQAVGENDIQILVVHIIVDSHFSGVYDAGRHCVKSVDITMPAGCLSLEEKPGEFRERVQLEGADGLQTHPAMNQAL
jgi:hypothetical protein